MRKNLAAQTHVDLDLLPNLVIGLEQVAPNCKHLTFMPGGKAYGAYLGRYKTPTLETDPRHFPPNFYYSQKDFLREPACACRSDALGVGPVVGCRRQHEPGA